MVGKISPTQFNMQSNKRYILSTRPLNEALINEAAAKGIEISTHAFIETEPVHSEALRLEIEKYSFMPVTAIFTSMNAVDAVVDLLDGYKPSWKIGCIGFSTLQLATHYFGSENIIALGKNAEELAKDLLAKEDNHFVFFCGDQRRDELPETFKSHGKMLDEVIVYKTIQQPAIINKNFDAIAFFSPSAAESFFSLNQVPSDTILFTIGKTTAEAVKKYTDNKIMIAEKPGKEQMVEMMISYFDKE